MQPSQPGRQSRGGMSRRVALAIMAKYPAVGAVKTRLAPALTAAQCAELYAAFLADKVDTVCALEGVTPLIAFTPAEAEADFAATFGARAQLLAQHGCDLGERLMNVAGTLFAGGYSHVLLVDSDTPDLPVDRFDRALAALAGGAQVVLGPTRDGGYYMIGSSAPFPALFRGIEWSSPRVLSQTLAIARRAELQVELLAGWDDVDTPFDLSELVIRLRSAEPSAPGYPRRTADVLARICASVPDPVRWSSRA